MGGRQARTLNKGRVGYKRSLLLVKIQDTAQGTPTPTVTSSDSDAQGLEDSMYRSFEHIEAASFLFMTCNADPRLPVCPHQLFFF